jgi:hypothetical protein
MQIAVKASDKLGVELNQAAKQESIIMKQQVQCRLQEPLLKAQQLIELKQTAGDQDSHTPHVTLPTTCMPPAFLADIKYLLSFSM